MSVEKTIKHKVQTAIKPSYLEVLNESHGHNVAPGSETHFKLVVVSEQFEGVRSVARHQILYKLLADELAAGVHALALHTYSVDEWEAKGEAPSSPACMGGSKK